MPQLSGRLQYSVLLLAALATIRVLPSSVKYWHEHVEAHALIASRYSDALEILKGAHSTHSNLTNARRQMATVQHQFLHASANELPVEVLASLVSEYSSANGLAIKSLNAPNVRVEPTQDTTGIVSVTVIGVGALESVLAWLSAIESGEPRLAVTRLDLHRQSTNADSKIDVRATVCGLTAHETPR